MINTTTPTASARSSLDEVRPDEPVDQGLSILDERSDTVVDLTAVLTNEPDEAGCCSAVVKLASDTSKYIEVSKELRQLGFSMDSLVTQDNAGGRQMNSSVITMLPEHLQAHAANIANERAHATPFQCVSEAVSVQTATIISGVSAVLGMGIAGTAAMATGVSPSGFLGIAVGGAITAAVIGPTVTYAVRAAVATCRANFD